MTELLWIAKICIIMLFAIFCAIALGLVIYGIIELVKWIKGDKHE